MKQPVDFFPGDVQVRSDMPDVLAENAQIANLVFARDIGRSEEYAYSNAIVYDPASVRDLTDDEKSHYLIGLDTRVEGNPLHQPEIYVGATAVRQFVEQERPKWLDSTSTKPQSAGLLTTTPADKKGTGFEGLHVDYGEYYGYRVGYPMDKNMKRDVLFGTRSPASLFQDVGSIGTHDSDMPKSSSECRALLEEYPELLPTVQVLIMPLGGRRGKMYRAFTSFVLHCGSTARYKEQEPSQMVFQFYKRQKPRR